MRNGTGFLGALTVFALNMLFMSLATILRLMPIVLPVLARLALGMTILSQRFYRLILAKLAPTFLKRWKIKLAEGLWRVLATVTLSLTLGTVVFLIIAFPINGWTMMLLVGHGLFVGLAWDELPQAETLTTGVRIQ